MEPGTTKNDEGRTFPVAALPALAALLLEQRELTSAYERQTQQIVPWVFHRRGKQIYDFRKAWRVACEAAGVPGRLVHDLRRTAVRNLERAAVPRSVAMKLTGHKTESVYRRYAIVCEADLAEGVRKLAALQSVIGSKQSGPREGLPERRGTKGAQFGATGTAPADLGSLDADVVERGTQELLEACVNADFPAALPATVPLDQAHWKLNESQRPPPVLVPDRFATAARRRPLSDPSQRL